MSSIDGLMLFICAYRHLESFLYLVREGYEDLSSENYNMTHFCCVFVEELSKSLALARDRLEHLCLDMYQPERRYSCRSKVRV
jgi:hypothetical protein